MNKVMLIGNLGQDAETRQTPSGTSVTNFSLATTARIKDAGSGEWKEKTDWHDVVLWRGERVAPYLTKGKKVFVEGRLQTRSWETQNGEKRYRTEVVCDPFGLMLLGGRDDQGGDGGGYRQGGARDYGPSESSSRTAPEGAGQPRSEPETPAKPAAPADDDDIPF
ncbi:MAG: single-stranded DNA-binding protein [Bryobacterales bacterium]|nr:single-stranded DNA-binding protein [Bryobacterales bacterium]